MTVIGTAHPIKPVAVARLPVRPALWAAGDRSHFVRLTPCQVFGRLLVSAG